MHRIARLQLELTYADEARARDLLARGAELHERRLAPLLEQIFDELDDPTQLLRIDRLELDLGLLSGDLDDELPRRLAPALRDALRRALAGRPATAPAARALELLGLFARTGAAPWWVDRDADDPIEGALRRALTDAPRALAELLRGLALDPAARWPSMKALLGQLSRDPARTARRVLLAGGVVALVGLSLTSVLQRRELEAVLAAQRCEAPSLEAWRPERREAIRAALASSGLSFAEDTWQRVSARLDGYAAGWSAMREEACEANRKGAESDLLYERRVACLEQSRDELAALVDVLATADKDVVGKAVRATLELRPLERCADASALLAPIAPPETPEAAATVARVRKELAAARAEWTAGRGKSAKERLQGLEPEITRARYKPLTAEAQYLIGVTADMLGDYTAAAAALEAAFLAAEASHHDAVAIESAVRLLFVVGYRMSKLDEAGLWERLTDAIMERQGRPREYESRWLSMRGSIRIRAGKLDEAAELLNSARLSAEGRFGPTSYEVASIINNLGSLSGIRGDHAGAEAHSRRALELLAGILGPDHPDLATLYVNCGAASFSQGRIDEARADFKRALAILGRSVGLDSPDAARLYHNLGGAHARAGEYDEALAVLLHAVELRRRLLGERHTDTANTEGTVGETYLELRRPEEALPYVERSLAGHRASVGEKHLRYGAALALHGRVLLELGKDDTAVAELQDALKILAASAAPREQLGAARFALARARWSSLRTQDEALALANTAREDFVAAGPLFAREVKDVERWLGLRGAGPAGAP